MTDQDRDDLQMVIDTLGEGVMKTCRCRARVDTGRRGTWYSNGDGLPNSWVECTECADGRRPIEPRDISPASDRANGLPGDALREVLVRNWDRLHPVDQALLGELMCRGPNAGDAIRAALVALATEAAKPARVILPEIAAALDVIGPGEDS